MAFPEDAPTKALRDFPAPLEPSYLFTFANQRVFDSYEILADTDEKTARIPIHTDKIKEVVCFQKNKFM